MAEEKKVEKIIQAIENLSVGELAELVKQLKEKFGITSTPTPAPTPAVAPAPQEKTKDKKATFNVVLVQAGASKISVIKAIKELIPDMGLKEAKDLVESVPKQILSGVNKEKAEEAKKKLESAGGKVELK